MLSKLVISLGFNWANIVILATLSKSLVISSALSINEYKAATTNPAAPEKLGSINVKADAVANDVDTHIYVSVTDAWGYTNKIKLPVTITKQ